MVNKNFKDDILIEGKPDSSVAKIQTSPEKTLELVGPVNISASALGADPTLAIGGVDIFNYVGSFTTVNTNGVTALSTTDTYVIVDHPASSGVITLNLPEISTLTGTKRYIFTMKGDMRFGDTSNGSYVRIQAAGATGDTTKGDFFDGSGEVDGVSGDWVNNYNVYYTKGSLEIHSSLASYTGGTTNGWVVTSSHSDKDNHVKSPARVASTGALVLSGVLAGVVVDGVTLVEHDRIILKDQATATESGVWEVGSVTNPPARPRDWELGSYCAGWEIKVLEGTANAGKVFSVSNAVSTSKLGTDAIIFVEEGFGDIGLETQLTDINTTVVSNTKTGIVTTVSAAIVADGKETFTVTCSECAATSVVLSSIDYAGAGGVFSMVTPAAGSFDVTLVNGSATTLDAVVKIHFLIIN